MPLQTTFVKNKTESYVDLDLEQFGYSSELSSSVSINKIVAYSNLSEKSEKSHNFSAVVDRVMAYFILIFIYFCIALEEIEWLISSINDKDSVQIIDESAWNIYKLIPRLAFKIRG